MKYFLVLACIGNACAETASLYLQLGHPDDVNSGAISPDGRFVVTGSDDKTTRLWDVGSGAEIRRFQGHRASVNAVTFSPDGRLVLTGGDTTARIWDPATGAEIRQFQGHTRAVNAVTFSPDGRFVLTGSADRTARLWDPASGSEIRRFSGHTDTVEAVAFSPDGRFVLTGSADKTARLWDAATGNEIHRFTGQSGLISSVAFSPDGKSVLTGSWDATARLWDTASGTEIRRFEGHFDAVFSVAFSPDGRLVLTGSVDKTARLWNTSDGKAVRQLKTTDDVRSVSFSRDGRFVLTCGANKDTPRLWDAATGADVQRFKGYFDPIWSVAFSPEGRSVLIASGDKTASLWEASTGSQTRRFTGHKTAVTSAAFSRDGRFVLTGGQDGSVRLWDAANGAEIRQFKGHILGIESVAFSPDGRFVLTAGDDTTARLWDAATGAEIRSLRPGGAVKAATFSPDGRFVLTGSVDNVARLWDAATGAEIRKFEGHTGWVWAVAFSPDGRTILTGSGDHTARLWDAGTGAQIRRFQGHSDTVWAVAFSPDGRRVLTGSLDNTARLWDASAATEVRRFQGDSEQIKSVAFSPDGRSVLTGSLDGKVRLWDPDTGNWLVTLVSLRGNGWAVVDPEGRYDASDPDSSPGLHFVAGSDVIELRQLKRRFYTPGLLSKIWRRERLDPLVASLRDVRLVPGIELIPPARGSRQATVRLTNRTGGIGIITVKVNGREIPLASRGAPAYKTDDSTAEVKLDLSGATLSPGGDNAIEVTAFNGEESIESRGVAVKWVTAPEAASEAPRVFAVVVGTSEYANERMNLRFTAKDALDIGNALRLAAAGLYNDPSRVNVSVLASGTAAEPSKQNIVAAFDAVAKQARPQDVLIVYFAGHGQAAHTERDQYYYFTKEAKSAEIDSDPALRSATTVSSSELREWLYRQNMPLKQVVVLDTCAAGAALGDIVKIADRRDLSPDQIRAIQFLKDSTGSWILMGSAADAVSYEANRYAQGLVTYALLEGMKGAALDGDQVEVGRLFGFAQREVEDLARGIGGIQRPILSAPKGQTFPIGLLKENDRLKIHLTQPKPEVLRARAHDEDDLDPIRLEPALRMQLRSISLPVARGAVQQDPALVYLDQVVDEVPDALIPVIRYAASGDQVKIRLRLLKNGKPVAERNFELPGGDAAELGRKLAAEVVAECAKAQ